MNGGGDVGAVLQMIVGTILGFGMLALFLFFWWRVLILAVQLGRLLFRWLRRRAARKPRPDGEPARPSRLAPLAAALRGFGGALAMRAWIILLPRLPLRLYGRPVPAAADLGVSAWWLKIHQYGDAPCFALTCWYRRPAGPAVKRKFWWAALCFGLGAFGWEGAARPDTYNIGPRVFLLGGCYLLVLAFGVSRLRMTITPDGLRWHDTGGRRCVVSISDMNGAEIVVMPEHTRAADEAATDVLNGKNTYPAYRIASEVMMHSGYRKMTTQQVAEFAKDRPGWKAKKLQAAVYAMVEAFAADDARRIARAAMKAQSLD